MVDARDFGNGKSAIFAKTLVWRRQVDRLGELLSKLAIIDSALAPMWVEDMCRYGQLMVGLTTTKLTYPRWHELQREASMLAHTLAERAARAEVAAQKATE